MRTIRMFCLLGAGLAMAACSTGPTRPDAWAAPEVLVAPSSFSGVHGLAVDKQGRLLAGSVVGNNMWLVDRTSGKAQVFIDAPAGQADDIAIGPKGEMAWTSYLQGIVRFRANDSSPVYILATDLPGINSLAFDPNNGKLYASQVFLGDAMWEIDVYGGKPPRLINKDMGGFNGFDVGPDGWLYGPLWFKGQVVKMNPANGAFTVINSEFQTPAAANLDGKGNLWVVDTKSGELSRVELATGRKTVARQLNTALDNLAIAPDGTIFVSNMADNAVLSYNPANGEVRTLTSGKLAVPAGMKIDGNTLWVADVFAFREVDLSNGAVRDIHRMQASDLEYPFAVGLSPTQLVLSSWFTGSVQLLDRATMKTNTMLHGFKAPMDAQLLADGRLAIAEIGTGSITLASGEGFKDRKVLASGLNGPVQMVQGKDGDLYVTEAAGMVQRIDLITGAKILIANNLVLPEGLSFTPWGSLVVAEAGARRLVEINPSDGSKRTIADNLPIGLEAGPGLPPPYVVTGVAVSADGTIYFSADR
ncbi:MAG: hypothetical protein ABIR94_23150, partial [Rubrivivax sp.]